MPTQDESPPPVDRPSADDLRIAADMLADDVVSMIESGMAADHGADMAAMERVVKWLRSQIGG